MRLLCLTLFTLALSLTAQEPTLKFAQDLAPEAAQEPRQEPAPILLDCSSCEAGVAPVDCLYCEGHGKLPCVNCAGWSPPRGNAIDQIIQANIDRSPGTKLSADQLRGKKAGTNEIACPVQCSINSKLYPWLEDDCPVCEGKRTFRCKDCVKGARSCVPCAGDGTVLGTCRRCLGQGHLPYLEDDLPTDSCHWCKGEGLLVCLKHFEPPREIGCGTCRKKGVVACKMCAGSKRILCNRCVGAGTFRSGARQETSKCDQCKNQRGYLECTLCEGKGKTTCPTCFRKKKLARGCGSCRDRFFNCAGCRLEADGQTRIVLALWTKNEVPIEALLPCVRAWTETAAQLEAESRYAQSVRWLTAAHNQAATRIKRGLMRNQIGTEEKLPEDMAEQLEKLLPQLEETLQTHLAAEIKRVTALQK